jgi:hypothetical protein
MNLSLLCLINVSDELRVIDKLRVTAVNVTKQRLELSRGKSNGILAEDSRECY